MNAAREELIEYITQHLQRCDFGRYSHNTCTYFECARGSDKNPEEMKIKLIEFNKQYILEEIDDKEVQFLMQLKDRIEFRQIKLMDEESMVAFGAVGFAYSMNGTIIIMNPR